MPSRKRDQGKERAANRKSQQQDQVRTEHINALIAKLQGDISKLESKTQALETENASLNENNSSLKEENTSLKEESASLKSSAGVASRKDLKQQLWREIDSKLSIYESERDFYFEKLKGAETLLQVYQEKNEEDKDATILVDTIFKVMYATTEDNVKVTDDGEVRFRS